MERRNSWAIIARALLFLLGTIGINVEIHYCGGEYIGYDVNGVAVPNEMGAMMPDCMQPVGDHCGHCKTVAHTYRLTNQYLQGSETSLHPGCTLLPAPVSYALPIFLYDSMTVEEDGCDRFIFYHSPYHPVKVGSQRTLRAPPVLA